MPTGRALRVHPAESTVSFTVDGQRVEAAEGEPIAVALAAAGRRVLGRSVKYHRPRGAACYAGRCDGCLMRVDGLANVMTCRTVAQEGMVVETQNVIGSAEVDLLSVTDWFFPDGMDHHHMFTRFKSMNRVMQKVARRVAGIGRLPSEVVSAVEPTDASCDVLVVGAGPGGLIAASAAARRGASVHVVEEESVAGGHLAYAPIRVMSASSGTEVTAVDEAGRLAEAATAAGARLLLEHAAVAAYDDPAAPAGVMVVVRSPHGIVRYRPRAIAIATGVHEGALGVEGNDLPGVLGVRAASRLLAAGVLPGRRVVVQGSDPLAVGLAVGLERLGVEVHGPVAPGSVARVRGRPQVKACDVRRPEGGDVERVPCDAVVLSAPGSAAYEIGVQAGLGVEWRGRGFWLEERDGGLVRPIGEVRGIATLSDIVHDAERAAEGLVDILEGATP